MSVTVGNFVVIHSRFVGVLMMHCHHVTFLGLPIMERLACTCSFSWISKSPFEPNHHSLEGMKKKEVFSILWRRPSSRSVEQFSHLETLVVLLDGHVFQQVLRSDHWPGLNVPDISGVLEFLTWTVDTASRVSWWWTSFLNPGKIREKNTLGRCHRRTQLIKFGTVCGVPVLVG